MGRGLIKLSDYYFDWSTIVDAPITPAMTRDELETYIREEYGREGLEQLPLRLERLERTGTSYHRDNVESVLHGNRAGPGETTLSAEEILAKGLRERDEP